MSRLRSSRGSKARRESGGHASRRQRPRRPGVLVQAPKSDIYVAMLGVALGAIVLACLLMLLILWRYDFKVNAKLAARDSGTPRLDRGSRHPRGTFQRPIAVELNSRCVVNLPSVRPRFRDPGIARTVLSLPCPLHVSLGKATLPGSRVEGTHSRRANVTTSRMAVGERIRSVGSPKTPLVLDTSKSPMSQHLELFAALAAPFESEEVRLRPQGGAAAPIHHGQNGHESSRRRSRPGKLVGRVPAAGTFRHLPADDQASRRRHADQVRRRRLRRHVRLRRRRQERLLRRFQARRGQVRHRPLPLSRRSSAILARTLATCVCRQRDASAAPAAHPSSPRPPRRRPPGQRAMARAPPRRARPSSPGPSSKTKSSTSACSRPSVIGPSCVTFPPR